MKKTECSAYNFKRKEALMTLMKYSRVKKVKRRRDNGIHKLNESWRISGSGQ